MRAQTAVLLLVLFAASGLPGCAVGLMEHDIPMDRDLRQEDLAFIREIKADAAGRKLRDAEIDVHIAGRKLTNSDGDRGRYVWVFPVFARRKTIVVSGSAAAVTAANEVPALFPGLSHYVGLRTETGARFSETDGISQARVTLVEINPLLGIAVSRKRQALRGWQFTLAKGLLGVGSSAYGPHMQLLWFFRFGESGDYSKQNEVKTIIRPLATKGEQPSGASTDATGAAAKKIF